MDFRQKLSRAAPVVAAILVFNWAAASGAPPTLGQGAAEFLRNALGGREPEAGMHKKAEVAPIKFVPGASLNSDFPKLHHAWCERVLIDPCRARMSGVPWNSEAIAFLELAVDDLDLVHDFDDPAPLAAQGKKVIVAGPIGRELIALDRAYLAEPSRKAQRAAWLSLLAVHAWLSGEYKIAEEPLAELRDQLAPIAKRKLQSYLISPAEMIADLALRAGSGAAEFDRGEEFLEKKDLERARTSYEDAAKLASERAAPLLHSRIAVASFERALATGDWVKLAPTPGLLDWTIESGEWEADGAGTLINKGTDARGVIFHRGRVGSDVEVRGEFEIESIRLRSQRFGIGLGYHHEAGNLDHHENRWVTCAVSQRGTTPPYATIYERAFNVDMPHKPFVFQPKNQFLARLRGRKVTFEVNGERFFEESEIPETCIVNSDGQIGFASFDFVRGNTTRIRNIEVRRIKAGQ